MNNLWFYAYKIVVIIFLVSWLLGIYTTLIESAWDQWHSRLGRLFNSIQFLCGITWGIVVGMGLNRFMVFFTNESSFDEYGEANMSPRAYFAVLLGIGATLLWAFIYHRIRDGLKYAKELCAQYRRDANDGLADAQYKLGVMYAEGNGIRRDSCQAEAWLKKAAEQNDADAQYYLGKMYSRRSSMGSQTEASKWFERAANNGSSDAQLQLGLMYYGGSGVQQDYCMAERLMRRAAIHGNNDAQVNLGHLYAAGDGIAKDHVLAYAWFSVAASDGNKDARKWIRKLNLRGPQIEEAKKLVSAWVIGRDITH